MSASHGSGVALEGGGVAGAGVHSAPLAGHDVLCVRAPNPGPLTLEGTNTWIVGREPAWVVDPGPMIEEHVQRVLAELQREGLIKHIGASNFTPQQFAEAQRIADIVCVQNLYNVANRSDDSFIANLASQGIAYVPFFPLGGFTPLQSSELDAAAASLSALAWLLHRSPNILLIPGTSSLKHLRENLQAATLKIPAEVIADLDSIGGSAKK